MSVNKNHKPRTGDGHTARGPKPSKTGHLRMETASGIGNHRLTQPKGWGIAAVVNLFKGKP